MKYIVLLILYFSTVFVFSNEIFLNLNENKSGYVFELDVNLIKDNTIIINIESTKENRILSAISKTKNIEIFENSINKNISKFQLRLDNNSFTPKIELLFSTIKKREISLIIQLYSGIVNMDEINKQTIKYKIGTYPKMLINGSCLIGEYVVFKERKEGNIINFFSSGDYSLGFQLRLKPGRYYIAESGADDNWIFLIVEK